MKKSLCKRMLDDKRHSRATIQIGIVESDDPTLFYILNSQEYVYGGDVKKPFVNRINQSGC